MTGMSALSILLIISEILSKILDKKLSQYLISDVKSPSMFQTYLTFAGDIFLFGQASLGEAENLKSLWLNMDNTRGNL